MYSRRSFPTRDSAKHAVIEFIEAYYIFSRAYNPLTAYMKMMPVLMLAMLLITLKLPLLKAHLRPFCAALASCANRVHSVFSVSKLKFFSSFKTEKERMMAWVDRNACMERRAQGHPGHQSDHGDAPLRQVRAHEGVLPLLLGRIRPPTTSTLTCWISTTSRCSSTTVSAITAA